MMGKRGSCFCYSCYSFQQRGQFYKGLVDIPFYFYFLKQILSLILDLILFLNALIFTRATLVKCSM